MTRITGAVLMSCALALVLTACGERPQVVSYKQGSYQGKPDTQPWTNAPYNGDRKQWDDAIRTRNQTQNEYKRIGG
jgi:hypothetical protein